MTAARTSRLGASAPRTAARRAPVGRRTAWRRARIGALPTLVAAALVLGARAAAPAHAADGPNLVLDVERMRSTARLATGIFHRPGRAPALDSTIPISGTCVLHPDEACVGGPGIRKLLRFDVLVHNRGDADLAVGNPKLRPDLFVYSGCHRHYHFRGAARYELLDASGALVRTGRKQGFCLQDTLPSQLVTDTPPRRYDCADQGVQVGWADWYPATLDCQWIDVTDVPPGDYRLHVFWNPDRLMPESTLADNEGTIPIVIAPPADAAPVVDAITAPIAGAVAHAGRPLDVAWRAHDDGRIVTQEIWLSTDDGTTFTQIVGDVPGGRTRHRFLVPIGISSTSARLKIVARDASVQRGERVSAPFRIEVPRPIKLPTTRGRGAAADAGAADAAPGGQR
ncbi:hypothetical protein K2Z84_09070 [Candidatus Binatia bacterium]|nr:hypothetical protein [Candidatus Binatia bacterium]